jgi:hypothetical protein
MQATFLLYGAAVQRGLRPLLAGRNEQNVSKLAHELGLDYRVFALENLADIAKGLADVLVVLNCAGPFAYTSRRLASACIQTATHYLDLAGEVPELQEQAMLDTVAKAVSVGLSLRLQSSNSFCRAMCRQDFALLHRSMVLILSWECQALLVVMKMFNERYYKEEIHDCCCRNRDD